MSLKILEISLNYLLAKKLLNHALRLIPKIALHLAKHIEAINVPYCSNLLISCWSQSMKKHSPTFSVSLRERE